jgi:uncharacterized protein YaiI (UPF0178 family)
VTEIYVDADACPVKDEVMRVAYRHQFRVHFVSNSFMRLDESELVNRVVVAEGPDVADDWIAERTGPGDIAITADIPLADRCVKAGAAALSPTGKPFSPESIGMALAMRNLMSDLRETGEITSHNPSFSRKNRSDFLQELEKLVQQARKHGAQ